MSALLRSLTPALKQWLQLTILKQHGFRNLRTGQSFLSSSVSSDDPNSLEDEDLDIDSTAPYAQSGRSKSTREVINENQRDRGDKWWRYKSMKLHRRKLTPEERQADESLGDHMQDIPESDIFGTLSGKFRPKSSRTRISSNPSKDFSEDNFRSLPWRKDEFTSDRQDDGSNPRLRDNPYLRSMRVKKSKANAVSENEWTEKFGTLQEKIKEQWNEDRDGDKDANSDTDSLSDLEEVDKPYRRLSDQGRHSADWYARQMRQFQSQGKIKEAIDVLDVWMLKNDRVRPNYYVYSILISILGKAGYTKKAFQVFNQMKKMGIKPKDNTYTALFNACSNSPWPEDGLKRSKHLRSLMIEKGQRPNLITYRAMIKAFGICGDIQTAFALLDEASVRYKPDEKCYNFLLMACCSDKEAGFRHAIMVWRLYRMQGLRPNLYLYNLLIRVIRDCGLGDPELVPELLQGSGTEDFKSAQYIGEKSSQFSHSSNSEYLPLDTKDKTGEMAPGHASPNSESDFHENEESEPSNLDLPVDNLLDILNSPLTNQNAETSLVSVNWRALRAPEARLALVGGAVGLISNMEADGIKPDIKTLTQLVNCIPSDETSEIQLIQQLHAKNIQPDVGFFNMIIRKRNLRQDYEGAKDIVKEIGTHKILPDMATFGCLAMGCRRREDGLQLLQDMQRYGLTPNNAVFTILILNSNFDFEYKLELIKQMDTLDIKPTEKLLLYIEKKVNAAKRTVVQVERGDNVPKFFKSDYFLEGYKNFITFYSPWLKRTSIEKEHPWSKFRHSKDEDGEDVDDVEDADAFVRKA